jgi:hypothetical protein
MKKPLLFILTLLSTGLYAQEHFSGISTSRRTGMLNATINPAELVNLKNNYEVNIFAVSANVSNNKVSFGDLVGGSDDFEDLIFSGKEPLNMRADVEILGPSFAFKVNKWAFAVSTGAKVRANVVDVDVDLGSALTNSNISPILNSNFIQNGDNQRVSATSWGEIGFSGAREIYSTDEHSISAGATFKLLFPGSYANISAGNFSGTIVTDAFGNLSLTDATANVNVAYSGSLANGTDSSNFTKFFAGGLNGFSTDIGVNYRWKDIDSSSTGYRLNAGLSVKNLGSMTFKDDNNVSRNYEMNIADNESFDLNQFENVEDVKEVEDILLANPQYFTAKTPKKDFKTKMPAVISAYADVKLYGRWYATAFLQQKLNEDGNNDQIAVQNILTITPRYSTNFFEVYAPLSNSEVSGFTAGIGFRVGGFFIGSGSILSAAISDTNQADAYLGFRIGF